MSKCLPGTDNRPTVWFELMCRLTKRFPALSSRWVGLMFLFKSALRKGGSHWGSVYLQGRCLDVADVAVRAGTIRADALKASTRVDAGRPAATVVLLA